MFYTNKMFWTKTRFKKYVYNIVISEENSNVCQLVKSPLTRPNYKSAAFPKFAEYW
jgi:hypothetical protein